MRHTPTAASAKSASKDTSASKLRLGKREKVPYTPKSRERDSFETIFVEEGSEAERMGRMLSTLDGYAAEVDGQLVTIADVRDLATLYNQRINRKLPRKQMVRAAFINLARARGRLIKDELILADFRSNGGSIPPQFIRNRMEQIIIAKYDGDQGAFLEDMQASGTSMDEFEDQVKRGIIIESMRAENIKPPGLSPKAVRDSYTDRKEEFAFEEGVDISLILLRTDQVGVDTARTKLAEIRQRAIDGEKAGNGGQQGRYSNQEMSPQLLDGIKGLQPGDVSEIIDFDGSVGIVEINENNETDGYTPFEEVREELTADVLSGEMKEMEAAWARQLREKFSVVIYDMM